MAAAQLPRDPLQSPPCTPSGATCPPHRLASSSPPVPGGLLGLRPLRGALGSSSRPRASRLRATTLEGIYLLKTARNLLPEDRPPPSSVHQSANRQTISSGPVENLRRLLASVPRQDRVSYQVQFDGKVANDNRPRLASDKALPANVARTGRSGLKASRARLPWMRQGIRHE